MEKLFRAKRFDNGEWVESGTLEQLTYTVRIGCYEVIPETVGQSTGYEMFDTKVFFGDLVSNNYGTNKQVIREIVEHEGFVFADVVTEES